MMCERAMMHFATGRETKAKSYDMQSPTAQRGEHERSCEPSRYEGG